MKKLLKKSDGRETSNVSVRVPILIKAKLKKAARENGRNITQQVVFFIEQGVKHLEKRALDNPTKP